MVHTAAGPFFIRGKMHFLDISRSVHVSKKLSRKKGGKLDLRFHLCQQPLLFLCVRKPSAMVPKCRLRLLLVEERRFFPVLQMTDQPDMKGRAGAGELKLINHISQKIFRQGSPENGNSIHRWIPFLIKMNLNRGAAVPSGPGKQFTFVKNKKIEALQKFKVWGNHFT